MRGRPRGVRRDRHRLVRRLSCESMSHHGEGCRFAGEYSSGTCSPESVRKRWTLRPLQKLDVANPLSVVGGQEIVGMASICAEQPEANRELVRSFVVFVSGKHWRKQRPEVFLQSSGEFSSAYASR